MSEAAAAERTATFSPKVVAAVVAVAVFAFSAFAVLSAYAPDLRNGADGRAHALSSSAIGYAGVVKLLEARGVPVVVSRSPPHPGAEQPLTVLTPGRGADAADLARFTASRPLLIVLPKWDAAMDARHPGWVRKIGTAADSKGATALLKTWSKTTSLSQRKGVSRPALHGTGETFARGTYLPLAGVDRLQSLSGPGWVPLLADETGAIVLARARGKDVYVLSDPDLLNTQGIGQLDNARAALAILDALRPDRGVAFDVTLAGFERGRSLAKLMFEPPLLAATLCALAAGLLMAFHAFARFGPVPPQARAFALGKRALVDNSAGLIRMAGKEAELAPAYAALTEAAVARAAGGDRVGADPGRWLDRMARARRTTDEREVLAAEAGRAKTSGDLKAVAAKLYQWRREMTRDSR